MLTIFATDDKISINCSRFIFACIPRINLLCQPSTSLFLLVYRMITDHVHVYVGQVLLHARIKKELGLLEQKCQVTWKMKSTVLSTILKPPFLLPFFNFQRSRTCFGVVVHMTFAIEHFISFQYLGLELGELEARERFFYVEVPSTKWKKTFKLNSFPAPANTNTQ